MWSYNYTDELYHHGVKGMKWGVRRAKRPVATTNVKSVSVKKNAFDKAKSEYARAKADKSAKSGAFDKAYNDSNRLLNVVTKERRKSYSKTLNETARESNKADARYKTAKKTLKEAKKSYSKELSKLNEGYSRKDRQTDFFFGGRSAVNRINKYMNKGDTLKSARTKSYALQGATVAASLIASYGVMKLR